VSKLITDLLQTLQYSSHHFPQIRANPLNKVLPKASKPALDLLGSLLVFDPGERPSAVEAMVQ
jgi:hypothetical protein